MLHVFFNGDICMADIAYTENERKILGIVQANLPDSLTPYADMAEQAGITEDEVLSLLRSMKEDGRIRRFGASLKHQRAGFAHNAMVAWKVDPREVDAAGTRAAEHDLISHCYYRPSSAEDWPYELYTMIHGRHPEECREVIAEVMASTGLKEYAVLESKKELKKISMLYF
jgi:DNA-binding Lrp family transcriptional regulator